VDFGHSLWFGQTENVNKVLQIFVVVSQSLSPHAGFGHSERKDGGPHGSIQDEDPLIQ
jgi:hypothetical protein